MRSFCTQCHIAADFIDRLTLRCEHCVSDLGLEAVNKAQLVSRQTVDGAVCAARAVAMGVEQRKKA
jgi:hypothetical protein